MKVITIGRGLLNDVALNDNKVSRVHCQIIQYDNGVIAVNDCNSTNGTYVNGRRITEPTALGKHDHVQIAGIDIAWQQYFASSNVQSVSTLRWLWPTVAASVALVVITAFLVFGLNKNNDDREILYCGTDPSISTITLEEEGVCYDVDAAEGQLIVIFNGTVSHKDAVKILKKKHAKIIAQMPDVHYYLIEVPTGKEAMTFTSLNNIPEIDYVYPNAIEVICSAMPYVIDNFYSDHGGKVTAMMTGCTPLMEIDTFNVGSRDGNYALTNGIYESIKKTLDNLGENESAVINMSFGPGLIRLSALWPWQNRTLWNDYLVTEGNKTSYKKRYIKGLMSYLEIAKHYDKKDFVIVKAAGNEGMKDLGVIIEGLKDEVSSEDYAVFERHFIIVSAKDDNKEGDYPNDVRGYNKMVTKVDISDMTAQDLHWQGTSFSSPRAAGYITSVANTRGMKVTNVLEYARKATWLHPEHLLTSEMMDSLIAVDKKRKDKDDEYLTYDCLKYRLVWDTIKEEENLELHNTCDEDIRVTGYLLNAVAPRGGSNTLDFEIIVQVNGTVFYDGFVENECTIKSVVKIPKKDSQIVKYNSSTTKAVKQAYREWCIALSLLDFDKLCYYSSNALYNRLKEDYNTAPPNFSEAEKRKVRLAVSECPMEVSMKNNSDAILRMYSTSHGQGNATARLRIENGHWVLYEIDMSGPRGHLHVP